VVPEEFDEDWHLIRALEARGVEAERVAWDEPGVAWDAFDRAVIRSTWNYSREREAFVAWAEALDGRLENSPAVVRWNSDKRYVADLAAAGLRVVSTAYVGPGDPIPALEGEVVVKPTISAGARDTGRFGPAAHDAARALIARLQGEGRVAMVQPYLDAVDTHGESALVYIAGEFSHSLRKRAVLRPDEEAPLRDDAIGSAEAMYDPGLVQPANAQPEERALADATLAHLAERFGASPLYARVDMLPGPEGSPVLLELEVIEPHLYLGISPGAADRLAAAITAR
jgi:hypothetical protein